MPRISDILMWTRARLAAHRREAKRQEAAQAINDWLGEQAEQDLDGPLGSLSEKQLAQVEQDLEDDAEPGWFCPECGAHWWEGRDCTHRPADQPLYAH
jgi:hypothetical protein